MKKPVLLETEDIRLLTQIGFIASGRADVQRAEVIFSALLHDRADRAFPYLGIATALLNAGRTGEAVMHLERAALPAGEEADMVQAFLGLSLQLDARASESLRVLRKVAQQYESAPPTPGSLLAQRLLGEQPSNIAKNSATNSLSAKP